MPLSPRVLVPGLKTPELLQRQDGSRTLITPKGSTAILSNVVAISHVWESIFKSTKINYN